MAGLIPFNSSERSLCVFQILVSVLIDCIPNFYFLSMDVFDDLPIFPLQVDFGVLNSILVSHSPVIKILPVIDLLHQRLSPIIIESCESLVFVIIHFLDEIGLGIEVVDSLDGRCMVIIKLLYTSLHLVPLICPRFIVVDSPEHIISHICPLVTKA